MTGRYPDEPSPEGTPSHPCDTCMDEGRCLELGNGCSWSPSWAKTKLASHKSEGKPLVNDLDPLFILDMGQVMTQGLTKYPNDPDGTPNWWKGGSYRSFIASIQRHALALASGCNYDDESGLPHAAHIAVDAMFVSSWLNRSVGVDDRLSS